MTAETRVMCGGLTSNPIAFSIPILLTIVLFRIRKISFRNKKFIFSLGVIFCWSIIQIYTKKQYAFKEFANYLYICYALIFAYIHIQVYGKKIFPLYEDVMLKLCLLSLPIWIFTCLVPDMAMSLASLFPETGYGYNFFFLVNWIRTDSVDQVSYGLIRNAGCSWEPGRFAIMTCLAFMISLYNRGLSLRKNRHILIYLITILTTMSTTGYILFFMIYFYMYLKTFRLSKVFKISFLSLPIILCLVQLDFIGEKLEEKINVNAGIEKIEESYQWTENHNENDNGVAYVMDRFPSFYFECLNFINDPIIGYGGNIEDSFFTKNYTDAIGFSGGLMTLFARHGVFFAVFLLYVLFVSSLRSAGDMKSNKKYGFLLCFLVSMISYPLIWFPLYTAFWFYGFFQDRKLVEK